MKKYLFFVLCFSITFTMSVNASHFQDEFPDLIMREEGNGLVTISGNGLRVNSHAINKENISQEISGIIEKYPEVFKTTDTHYRVFKNSFYNGKYTVELEQIINDIPVWQSRIFASVLPTGEITYIHSNFIPALDVNTTPSIKKSDAEEILLSSNINKNDYEILENELIIFPGNNGEKNTLCWHIKYQDHTNIVCEDVFMDANTGAIVEKKDSLRHGWYGTVSIIPYSLSASPSRYGAYCRDNAIKVYNLISLQMEGPFYTGSNGQYYYTGTTSSTYCRVDDTFLRGKQANVYNYAGSNAEVDRVNGITSSFSWNTFATYGEQQLYFYMTDAAHKFEGIDNDHYWLENPMTGYANYGSNSANGTTIYTRADNIYGNLVYHEYGHNIIYKFGNHWLHADLDEALPDYFACSFCNNSTVWGTDRSMSSSDVRGACWALRTAAGTSTADGLIYAAADAAVSASDKKAFMDLILTLDNTGGWEDGTPNDVAIFSAFTSNGILGSKKGGTLPASETWSNGTYVLEDFTIPSGMTVTVNTGATIYLANAVDIEISGTLIMNSGSKLTKVSGETYWSGIDLNSGGSLVANGDCTIEYASAGIDLYGGSISNSGNTITVQNCSMVGVAINSTAGSPTVQNINCKSCTGTYGGILKTGTTNNPMIRYNTVETSKHALYISGNASVTANDFKNTNTNHTITFAGTSTVNLDGSNNIVPISASYKAINNRTDTTTDAENNWWGTASPTDALFTFPAYVDYSPYRNSAAAGGVYKPTIEQDLLEIAEDLEISGDYDKSLEAYISTLASEVDPNWRQFIITSILRVHDKYDQDYHGLRVIIEDEMKSAEGYYGVILRFVLSDIDVREGNYQQAIDELKNNADFYKDTAMEVEILGRIAEIYGLNLNDKGKAQEYAQLAAAINPGQPSLRSAFNAAGIEYNTTKHENRFEYVVDNYDTPPVPENQTSEESKNNVVVSPNPFNPSTTLSYTLAEDSKVTLAVYNLSGQKVATLVDSAMPAGTHQARFDGSGLASGMYFYRFESGNVMRNGKMLLVK